MAVTRVRRTINLGNGWKQVVYLKPIEFLILNLLIFLPIYIIVESIKALAWLYFILPYKGIKFIYRKVTKAILNLRSKRKTNMQ
jgi:hypothetical protein